MASASPSYRRIASVRLNPMATVAPGAVRWGIIGSGLICSDFCQALRSAAGAQIVAIAARSLEKAQQFAETNEIPTAYGDYESICADDEVDIVYIGTIHPTHKALALLAIAAGKHVLVEKPMTLSYADTAELYSAAEAKGVLLVEALWTRFFPTVAKARELITAGEIGDVLQVHGDFGFRFDDVDGAPTHRLTDPALGGGATLDIGVYPISCMLLAFGTAPPSSLEVAGLLTPSGVDKTVSVSAVFGGGRLAHLTWTIEAQTPEEWRIIGSKGMITFNSPAHAPYSMTVRTEGKSRMDAPKITTIKPPPPQLLPEAQPLNFPGSEGFLYQAEAVSQAVKDGKTEIEQFTSTESLAAAALCDAILAKLGVVYDC